MNPISKALRIGTLGELFVQLRLLQFGVQAAAPLKDSGNDLIAIRGEAIRAIQVKTTTRDSFRLNGLPQYYHGVALVKLVGENRTVHLDKSQIFILQKADIRKESYSLEELKTFQLTPAVVNRFFREPAHSGLK